MPHSNADQHVHDLLHRIESGVTHAIRQNDLLDRRIDLLTRLVLSEVADAGAIKEMRKGVEAETKAMQEAVNAATPKNPG